MVFRIKCGKALRKDIHLCRCLLDRNPGLQMAYQRTYCGWSVAFAPGKGFGKPHIRTPTKLKRGGHHRSLSSAGHSEAGFADDLRVSAANLLCQALCLKTTTDGAPGSASAGMNVRPIKGGQAEHFETCCRSPLHPVESHRASRPVSTPRRAYNRSLCQIHGSVCGIPKLLNREPSPVVIRAIRQVLHDHYSAKRRLSG